MVLPPVAKEGQNEHCTCKKQVSINNDNANTRHTLRQTGSSSKQLYALVRPQRCMQPATRAVKYHTRHLPRPGLALSLHGTTHFASGCYQANPMERVPAEPFPSHQSYSHRMSFARSTLYLYPKPGPETTHLGLPGAPAPAILGSSGRQWLHCCCPSQK